MRTTLTLDPYVAKLAVRMQRGRGTSIEAIINEALMHGHRIKATPTEQPEAYQPLPPTSVEAGSAVWMTLPMY